MKKLDSRWIFFLLVLTLVLSALYPGCARNPATGKRELTLISEQQEIAMGREAHPQILAQYGSVENPGLQSYVRGLGQQLAQHSHRPELEWHFEVVDVPVVNAFALPGGYIYLTREILGYMNNEAELAGVLGHEIAHVDARHSVSQMSKAQLFSLGLGIGSIVSPTFAQLSGLAEQGLGLLFLKYGRDDENQADSLGLGYMTRLSYDPRAIPDFFQVFQQLQEDSGQTLPSWLSSHPTPPERIRRTRQEAETALAQRGTSDLRIERADFMNHINGILFGENPREGFMQEGGWFIHPDLRFRMRFPQGWRVQNTKSSVVAVEPNGAAAIQLTLAREQASPEQYASRIASQPGTRLLEGRRTNINGNPSFLGVYQIADAQTQQSTAVLAAFISYGGRLYQAIGLTSARQFNALSPTFESSLTTFDQLNDSRALSVQPDRIRVVNARQGETLSQISQRVGNPRIKLEKLALLNRLEPNEPLRAGAPVKVVEPGRR